MANRNKIDYYCNLVSENVKIVLKNNPPLSLVPKSDLFMQCDQLDCQYVDINQPPCPLSLDLFSEEIKKREKNRRDRKMGF